MALSLTQRQQHSNSPGLLFSQANVSGFPPAMGQLSGNQYPARGTTSFNDDYNHWLLDIDDPAITSSPSLDVNLRGTMMELEAYKGFSLSECGEITITYNKDLVFLSRSFKLVFLNRQAHNDFYHDPYLVVCFELELEGSGNTKEAAMNDLCRLLDVYFNQMREINKEPDIYVGAIIADSTRKNSWKQSCERTYKLAQKLEKIDIECQHKIA